MRLPSEEFDISGDKPFADFIGREYQLTSRVDVLAWNDFPDKEKILNVILTPPPGVRNRFVSSTTPLDPGQRVRIIGARRRRYGRGLLGEELYYAVAIPGVRLPDGVPVEMRIGRDGIPPPAIYTPIGR